MNLKRKADEKKGSQLYGEFIENLSCQLYNEFKLAQFIIKLTTCIPTKI